MECDMHTEKNWDIITFPSIPNITESYVECNEIDNSYVLVSSKYEVDDCYECISIIDQHTHPGTLYPSTESMEKQFKLDAHRLSIKMNDSTIEDHSPEDISEYVEWFSQDTKDIYNKVMEMCTQAVFAFPFELAHMHLMDIHDCVPVDSSGNRGEVNVYLDNECENGPFACFELHKVFDMMRLGEHSFLKKKLHLNIQPPDTYEDHTDLYISSLLSEAY